MATLHESDVELEQLAKQQAEAIAHAEFLRQQTKMQLFFKALGKYLGITNQSIRPATPLDAKPGRELLLWEMRRSQSLEQTLSYLPQLLQEPRFQDTLPDRKECVLISYESRKTFNEAAKEWTSLADPKARVLLRCDRKLIIARFGSTIKLTIVYKDLQVQRDKQHPEQNKLIPTRSEGSVMLEQENYHQLIEYFPKLTSYTLTEALRQPAKSFTMPGKVKGNSQDAYIANRPLRVRLDEIVTPGTNKKSNEAEELGKGFANWIANMVKNK